MPTFCRHGRFIERCPICSRDLPGAPARGARTGRSTATRAPGASAPSGERRPRSDGLKIRRETRATDDGYRSPLVAGLRASADAERLADELAFSCARLAVLGEDPPGTYRTARDAPDAEEGTWVALLTAYLSPLDDDEDPFRAIRGALTPWSSGELPDLDGVELGPRTSHDPARGAETLIAYRQWAERSGSQAAALAGDAGWTAPRRFERAYERLSLPGLTRVARFDFLVSLGRLGRYEMEADSLQLVGDDDVTLAAKRVFGIGDRINLERRARALADAIEAPLQSLDLALANWRASQRMAVGVAPSALDEAVGARARDALGL